jgi:hypothetical protein
MNSFVGGICSVINVLQHLKLNKKSERMLQYKQNNSKVTGSKCITSIGTVL